jgi:hypothetical protein
MKHSASKMLTGGLEVWLKRYSACFANRKQRVQTPVPPKQKKKNSILTGAGRVPSSGSKRP